jgi:hypothetical protein
MENKYCSYELSKLAKDAGFNEKSSGIYDNGKFRMFIDRIAYYTNHELNELYYKTISAPELTHLQQWVYEKFKVWISPYNSNIGNNSFSTFNIFESFDCPYKALEFGLLEFLKTQNL